MLWRVGAMQLDLLAGCAALPPAPALQELSPTGVLAVLSLATFLASPDGLGPSLLMRKEVRTFSPPSPPPPSLMLSQRSRMLGPCRPVLSSLSCCAVLRPT